METWRPIPSEPGYEVSDLGRVRSVDRVVTTANGQHRFYKGKVLSPGLASHGYLTVAVSGRRSRCIQHLVAEAFLGLRPDGCFVLHADDVRTNNLLGNLRYGSRSENSVDSVKNGRRLLSPDDILKIRDLSKAGLTVLDIAGIFGVTRRFIYYILSGEQYGSV